MTTFHRLERFGISSNVASQIASRNRQLEEWEEITTNILSMQRNLWREISLLLVWMDSRRHMHKYCLHVLYRRRHQFISGWNHGFCWRYAYYTVTKLLNAHGELFEQMLTEFIAAWRDGFSFHQTRDGVKGNTHFISWRIIWQLWLVCFFGKEDLFLLQK